MERLWLWWRIKTHPVVTILVILVIALVVLVILGGYLFHWDWAGFNGKIKSGKTLWDWLQLLIIPLALAIIAIFFNRSERKNEQRIASDNQQETALQEYIKEMSELLLHGNLRESQPGDEVRTIARVRTLTVLLRLNKERKSSILKFLYESGLIDAKNCIIDLSNADLRGADLSDTTLNSINLSKANLSDANLSRTLLHEADLRGTNLSKANLSNAKLIEANLSEVNKKEMFLSHNRSYAEKAGTNLSRANLQRAFLVESNLEGADITYTNLSKAVLTRAKLMRADLNEANLRGANLSEAELHRTKLTKANLREADLTGAKVTKEQLETVKSLQGATMPDGSKHP